MHRRHKYDIAVLAAVAGLCVSLYLAITKLMGIAVPCSLTHGCETVLSSKYSVIFGIPLPLWGMAFFVLTIVLSLLANHYASVRRWLTIWLGIGSLMAIYFLSLQFFVIKSICQYCLFTDLLTITIFLWDLNVEHRHPQLPVA